MKRIIDGIAYDTERATEISSASSGGSTADYHFWAENLYKTAKGRWFVYGKGGAGTQWSVTVEGDHWQGGSDITPLTPDEAQAWLEQYASADIVLEHFADKIQEA